MKLSELMRTLGAGESLVVRRSLVVQREGGRTAEVITVDDDVVIQGIVSNPPKDKYKVTNLYMDPDSGKLVVEYDNTPAQ